MAPEDGGAHFTRTCPTHGFFATDVGPYGDFYARQFEHRGDAIPESAFVPPVRSA